MYVYTGLAEIDYGDAVFSDNIEWDALFHLPVAKNDFIKKYTGTDVSNEYQQAGTNGKAYYRRIFYVLILQGLIDRKVANDHDKMMNDYNLAHDTEKQDYFAYLTSIIADADDHNMFGDVAVEHGLKEGVPQDAIRKAMEIPMLVDQIDRLHLYRLNWNKTISKDNYQRGY